MVPEQLVAESALNMHSTFPSNFQNTSVSDDVSLAPWSMSSTSNSSYNDTEESQEFFTPGVQEKVLFIPWKTIPGELISYQAYAITDKVVHMFLVPPIFLIGVPTNVLSALVFYRQGLRDRMNLCLFALALVDASFVSATFVVAFSSFLQPMDFLIYTEYLSKILVYFVFFQYGMKSASACISMVVAVERCVCVVFPLRANSIMRTRTMGALLATIVILSTLAHSILCFQFKAVRDYDEATGLTYYKQEVTDIFLQNPLLFNIFFDIILSFVLPLVTFVVVGVATAITVIKLRTAMAWRASTSSGRADNHSQQQQAALTKMLVILSCIFMACSAPYTALSIVRLLVSDFNIGGRYVKLLWASHAVSSTFLAPSNSAVNFFVYYTRSSRFRSDLREMFNCCKAKDKLKSKKAEDLTTVVSEF